MPGRVRALAPAGRNLVRIVKKTLKGNLLGKTKVRAATSNRARSAEEDGGGAELPTRLKPRTQATLDALVKDDDVVVIPSSLKPIAGTPIPIGRPERETRQAQEAARVPPPPPAPAPPARKLPRFLRSPEREAPEPEVRTEGLRAVPPRASQPPAAVSPDAAASKTLRGKPKAAPAPAPAASPAPVSALTLPPDADSVTLARAVLANALLRAFGEPGSELRQPKGTMFHVAPAHAEGVVRTQHLVTIPLPSGHVVSHEADLVIELDNKAVLMVDVIASHTPPEAIKARSFDALLLRRIPNSFSVLVCVRTPGPGIAREQLEAIAHGYDLHFGIDAPNVHLEAKFAALRSRITAWLDAAAKAA